MTVPELGLVFTAMGGLAIAVKYIVRAEVAGKMSAIQLSIAQIPEMIRTSVEEQIDPIKKTLGFNDRLMAYLFGALETHKLIDSNELAVIKKRFKEESTPPYPHSERRQHARVKA